MKKLLFIIFSLPTLLSHATNHLTIYLHSGAQISIPVEEKPQITFEGNVLCINTERFQITDVKKYTFSENEAVGIETIEAGKDGMAVKQLEGEKIAVNVKDTKAVVRVYSTNGVERNVRQSLGPDGQVILDLTGLMPDVYVISVDSKTFKIRKK